jgi:type III secretion protein T
MNEVAILQAFRPVSLHLLAAALAVARMVGVMMVLPVFTRLGVTGILRNGIGLTLAVPVVPMIAAGIDTGQLSPALVGALLFKEVAIGVVVGLVLGVPFFAAEIAGDVLDLQRGSSSASLVDPLGAVEANITGTLLALVILALFFGSGGLPLTLRALYDSYGIWPVRRFLPLFSSEAGGLLLHLLDTVVALGVMLAAPIMVCLLLVDLLFAFLSRAAPQLQVFYLSLGVKNLLFSLILVLYGAFMIGYMRDSLAILLEAPARLQAIGPAAR